LLRSGTPPELPQANSNSPAAACKSIAPILPATPLSVWAKRFRAAGSASASYNRAMKSA